MECPMKKTVLLILAVLTAAILSSGCFAEELSSGDYLYSILADGTAEILSFDRETSICLQYGAADSQHSGGCHSTR